MQKIENDSDWVAQEKPPTPLLIEGPWDPQAKTLRTGLAIDVGAIKALSGRGNSELGKRQPTMSAPHSAGDPSIMPHVFFLLLRPLASFCDIRQVP